MNNDQLLGHIRGKAGPSESEDIIGWIDEAPENRQKYIEMTEREALSRFIRPEEFADNDEKEAVLRDIKRHRRGSERAVSSYVAAAVAVLLAVSLSFNVLQKRREDRLHAKYERSLLQETEDMTFCTESGTKGRVILPDGTEVILNSQSKLSYPSRFSMDSREVKLDGEAYFDVVEDSEWPMLISTPKGTEIKVLGTRFNIKAYSSDSEETATLFSGKISIKRYDGTGKTYFNESLKPLETARIKTLHSPVCSIQKADTLKASDWKRGELILEGTTLKEAFTEMERRYGCSIRISDPAIEGMRVNAFFTSESMIQIMELLKFSIPVEYRLEDGTFIVSAKKQ